MPEKNLFSGRKLVIASMHEKERVIGPMVASQLGVLPMVSKELDTDQFGTFSGEIERIYSPLDAARLKCKLAMNLTGCDLAIATEGSFFAHPELIFFPANEELVMLLDKRNNLEITESKLSINTNFDGRDCNTLQQLLGFAESIGFPECALILRNAKGSCEEVFKGIRSREILIKKFNRLMNSYGKVYAETDMRAMHNPIRMKVIAEATKAMLTRLAVTCIKCKTPGFGRTGAIHGLACANCGLATSSPKFYIYKCAKCNYQEKLPVEAKSESPMHCKNCNP
ncbi:DUF6671 family protein [Desertivirga brevis]|uniref:DUF6671 family protein n=1 Tax=Desertivirga brevis TaxID=2810310 RepID=UPI001A96489F|nr:DUF6671 family protein [Pedobacter sp. SYSU D00873]